MDAARSFNSVLMYINRVKQYHTRSTQYDQILKKNEQMYALLAITVTLSPAAQKLLDENVTTQLRERNAEKMAKMVRGDVPAFDEAFTYACPKFIAPSPPAYDSSSGNTSQTVRGRHGFGGCLVTHLVLVCLVQRLTAAPLPQDCDPIILLPSQHVSASSCSSPSCLMYPSSLLSDVFSLLSCVSSPSRLIPSLPSSPPLPPPPSLRPTACS